MQFAHLRQVCCEGIFSLQVTHLEQEQSVDVALLLAMTVVA